MDGPEGQNAINDSGDSISKRILPGNKHTRISYNVKSQFVTRLVWPLRSDGKPQFWCGY